MKVNRMNLEKCIEELQRLRDSNQATSKRYAQVLERKNRLETEAD